MPALADPRPRRIVPLPAPRPATDPAAPARWLALVVVGLLLAAIAFATRGVR
jgi:hypothetical protein